MIEYNDGQLTIALENVSPLTWVIIVFAANAIYGIVTHIHSIREVKKYNNNVRNPIGDDIMFWTFIYRMFINLPVRITCVPLGLVTWFIVLVSAGKSRMNDIWRCATRWHFSAMKLREMF